MKFAYYPGCSMDASSTAYDLSTRRVCEVLGIELAEIEDWNCCGATEYFTLDRLTGHSVIARNLALVDPDVRQVVAPCSACYLNLKKTNKLMREDRQWCAKINTCLEAGGLSYSPGRLEVRHLLDVLYTDVGEQRIRNRVVQPLKGLRIAPYYGCQIVRPLNGFDDPEYPTKLDKLLGWLGAKVVDFPVKSHCCGGHMTQISESQAYELIRRLLSSAQQHEAAAIACLCPMCQLNLDAYQGQVNRTFDTSFQMPVVFFTQLIGLAFGLEPQELGFGRELISAQAVVDHVLHAEPPEDEGKPKRKRKPKKNSPELPMPALQGQEDEHG